MLSVYLQDIMATLKVVSELETAMSDFYKTCAHKWPQEKSFWEGLEIDEKTHVRYIAQLSDIIKAKPGQFQSGRLLNVASIKAVIASVKRKADSVRDGSLTHEKTMFVALDLERSLLENRYMEIVKTQDLEFLTLVKKVVDETNGHRDKITKKIDARHK